MNPEKTDEQKNLKKNESEQNELELCQATLAEWQDKYARLSADYQNFKRRQSKEQAQWSIMAQSNLLTGLLSIVDNFDRAMAHRDDESESWAQGIGMIHSSLHDFLSKANVKEMAYDSFDPEMHEALMQVESGEHEAGQIVEVLEKGYMLGDKVLRVAKVSVAK